MYILNLDQKTLACSSDLGKLMGSALELVGRHYDLCNTNSCTMSMWRGTSDKLVASILIDGCNRSLNKVASEPDDPSILSIIKVDEI